MKKRKLWQELTVVLLIIVPLMTLVWFPILTSDTKPWEAGRPIPIEPPSESRRISNNAGFSIIAPPNWIESNRDEPAMIHLTPRQVFAGRSKAGISVTSLHKKPSDLREVKETEFLGYPAYLKVERRPTTFDDPARTTWTFYVQQDNDWLRVSFLIAKALDEIPTMLRRYLETAKFRFDE